MLEGPQPQPTNQTNPSNSSNPSIAITGVEVEINGDPTVVRIRDGWKAGAQAVVGTYVLNVFTEIVLGFSDFIVEEFFTTKNEEPGEINHPGP